MGVYVKNMEMPKNCLECVFYRKTGRWAWPSAVKTAEWIESTESRMRPFMCSNCGCIYDVDTFMGEPVWNYCPHCGAKMVIDNE